MIKKLKFFFLLMYGVLIALMFTQEEVKQAGEAVAELKRRLERP